MERHAGDGHGVLHRQKESAPGTLVGRQGKKALPVDKNIALRHLVVQMPHQRVGKRAFAGAVRSHQGVRFALFHHKVYAFEDFFAFHVDVQITNFQCHWLHTPTPSNTQLRLTQ